MKKIFVLILSVWISVQLIEAQNIDSTKIKKTDKEPKSNATNDKSAKSTKKILKSEVKYIKRERKKIR